MSWRLSWVAVTVLFVAACGGDGGDDNARPSSNANLASLVITGGVLDPAFTSATTAYTSDVRWSIMATRVTGFTSDSNATLTINGTVVASGVPSNPIALGVGDTTISAVVRAADGTEKTYTVIVTRAVAATDADLDDLDASVASLVQIFDPALTSYDVSAGHLGASTRVIAELSDPFAESILVNGTQVEDDSPSMPFDLVIGANNFNVDVTAEDGSTTKRYSITVDRALFGSLAQRAYAKATNTDQDDRFGSALAVVGDNLLIGAPFEQSSARGVDGDQANDSMNNAGAAYLHERLGGVWNTGHYLKASNTDTGDLFGWAAAATPDHLALGAPGEQSLSGSQADNSGTAVGAVYLFDATVALPAQTTYLKASNPDENDRFGSSLAMSEDRLLVGAPFEQSSATGVNGDQDNNTLSNTGAAYLFEENGTGWTQIAYIKASNTRTDSEFGSSLAISDDTLAIGARRESSGSTGVNGNQTNTNSPDSGAVYVFDEAGSAWTQSAYIKASNTQSNDDFGFALDLDADLLAVGAPGEDSSTINNPNDNGETDSGAVYVFVRNGAGQWSQEAYIKAPIPGLRDFFGASVALVGNMLAIGAPGERSGATGINGNDADESEVDSGAVYVFERDGAGNWNQIAYIKASNTDGLDLFGRHLALGGDTLAVGAPGEAGNAAGIGGNEGNNALPSAGAVYIFR